MDPRKLDAAGFWKLAGLYLDSSLPGDAELRRQLETAWAAVAVALAHFGRLPSPRRAARPRAGRSSATPSNASYGCSGADEDRLLDELPQLARLPRREGRLRQIWPARRSFSIGPDPEAARRHLARDYYAALSTQDA